MPVVLKPGTEIPKDPDAELPYQFDWEPWLGVAAIIATSDWAITPTSATDPLEVDTEQIDSGDKSTTVRLIGGEAGTTYRVTNRITTNEVPPRIDDRTLLVKVKER